MDKCAFQLDLVGRLLFCQKLFLEVKNAKTTGNSSDIKGEERNKNTAYNAYSL
jgi:hypothetical protein